MLPHITPSIGFEPALAVLPLGDCLQSLTAAHLDVLVMQGRLRAEVRDNTTRYVAR